MKNKDAAALSGPKECAARAKKAWRWFGWFRPRSHPKKRINYRHHFGAEFRIICEKKVISIYEVELGQMVNPRFYSGWRRWLIEMVIERMFLRPARKRKEEELAAAFERAVRFVRDERNSSPSHGFGRGSELGEAVLKRFMPAWFQRWMLASKWHEAGLLNGEEGWWSYVEAFGLTRDEWWERVQQEHNYSQ